MVDAADIADRRAVGFADAPVRFVLVALLLAATFVALLWVPSYARVTPALDGIPFFYWYSVLWLLLNAASQIVAYQVVSRHTLRPGRGAAQ